MNLLRGFGSFLGSTATLLTGLLAGGASLVATGVSMLAASLGLSVPALLIGAVALLLLAGAIYLYNNSEGFRTVIDTVVDYFMGIIEIIGNIFGGFYDFFAGLFTGDFDRMFSGIKDILGGLWDLILAPFKAIGDFFSSVFGIDIGQIIWFRLTSMVTNPTKRVLTNGVDSRLVKYGVKVHGSTTINAIRSEPANVEAIQRGSQQALSSEEIDNLSTEEQVKLGYAKATTVSGEDGKEMVQFESTDK